MVLMDKHFSTLTPRVLISFFCHKSIIFLSTNRYNIIITKEKDNKIKNMEI